YYSCHPATAHIPLFPYTYLSLLLHLFVAYSRILILITYLFLTYHYSSLTISLSFNITLLTISYLLLLLLPYYPILLVSYMPYHLVSYLLSYSYITSIHHLSNIPFPIFILSIYYLLLKSPSLAYLLP
ncbi:uncharacterized protein VICG_01809, partial [Vittaforma corneae ATCC 50505]